MSNQQDRSQSPFAALSFSEQQEMWRQWRSQKLDYHPVAPKASHEPESLPPPPPMPPAPQPYQPPSHKNLDRVHARISAAAAHAGHFTPLT